MNTPIMKMKMKQTLSKKSAAQYIIESLVRAIRSAQFSQIIEEIAFARRTLREQIVMLTIWNNTTSKILTLTHPFGNEREREREVWEPSASLSSSLSLRSSCFRSFACKNQKIRLRLIGYWENAEEGKKHARKFQISSMKIFFRILFFPTFSRQPNKGVLENRKKEDRRKPFASNGERRIREERRKKKKRRWLEVEFEGSLIGVEPWLWRASATGSIPFWFAVAAAAVRSTTFSSLSRTHSKKRGR